MVDFYIIKVFDRITRMFLDMASMNDIMPILSKEMERNPDFKIFNHHLYGHLENILYVLNDTFSNKDVFRKEIEKKSRKDFERYRDISERCLDEIDRLTMMLIGLPKVQGELFSMRIFVYGLRDMIEKTIWEIDRAEKGLSRNKLYSGDIEAQAMHATKTISDIFNKRRRLIDSMLKNRRWFSSLQLLLFSPCHEVWSRIKLVVRQVVRKHYLDCKYEGSTGELLKEWRKKRRLTSEEASQELGIPTKDYWKYEYNYQVLEMSVLEKIKGYLQNTDEIKKEPNQPAPLDRR